MEQHSNADNVAPLRFTAFGRVLCELLEERELPVTPFHVGKMVEDAGLDGWKVINRMADAGAPDPGYLDVLVDKLALTKPEMVRLAMAYSYEEEVS